MDIEKPDLEDRLKKQISFLIEIDKVKSIFRKTRIFHTKRYENDAEHAWHLAMMAIILSEHSNQPIDILKVIKMTLIHDLVEIDAGDTFLYAEHQEEKVSNERKCAERIFGLLPDEQRDEFLSLWEEFEAKQTAEAKFAGSIDRLEPVMQNHLDQGHAWKMHHVTSDKVLNVNRQIENGSNVLWEFARTLIQESVEQGNL